MSHLRRSWGIGTNATWVLPTPMLFRLYKAFFLGAFQHKEIIYVLATIITICTLSFKKTWNPFQKPSQELMWASMGFFENFQLPKMQFPPSLLPPKQVRCNSYDPSLFLRWSYSSGTDLKRIWNGGTTEVQRRHNGGIMELNIDR